MELERLKEILDIDGGEDFQYFESFAALMEHDEEIEADLIAQALKGVNFSDFSEMAEGWFDEIIGHLPDEAGDIENILEEEKKYILAMAGYADKGEENAPSKLWIEIERFRKWFTLTENCTIHDHKIGESYPSTLSEAIAEHRYSKISNHNIGFDFSDAGDYEVEEYIVMLGDLI